ncbi:hypothetical protein [Dyella terrae]|uniref:hypothetical protein n=1 Tax=Dyella terrae TaxID=522259 RepID=UPI003D18C38A|nr:hypothetical protein DYST_02046 [Dyella terrae]
MRTNNLFRKTLMAVGLATAFSAMPFAQVAAQQAQENGAAQQQAQDAAMQQKTSNETVPGRTNDAWITTKVKSQLATTNGIKSNDISVATADRVRDADRYGKQRRRKDQGHANRQEGKGCKDCRCQWPDGQRYGQVNFRAPYQATEMKKEPLGLLLLGCRFVNR